LFTQGLPGSGEVHLQMATKTTSALWNEYIERYHYLGYTPLPGAQLRYFITADTAIPDSHYTYNLLIIKEI